MPRWSLRNVALAALAVCLTGAIVSIWTDSTPPGAKTSRDQKAEKSESWTGKSSAKLNMDGVHADLIAQWEWEKKRVNIELSAPFESKARFLSISSDGHSKSSTRKGDWYPESPQLSVPVDDPLNDVTVRVAIGGEDWKRGSESEKVLRMSPTGRIRGSG